MILQEASDEKKQSPDSIAISNEARERQVQSRISDKIVSQITKNDYYNDFKK